MNFNSLSYHLAFFVGAFIISYITNRLMLRFARTLGIRNKNDVTIRWSEQSKPSLGGISLYFTFIIAVFVYATFFSKGKNLFEDIEFLGLLGSGTLAFAIGMSDDAYNTRPLLKLFGQIMCGLILAFTGNGLDIFHVELIDGFITIVWVVAVMNSLNMLDNMDGITGTTSLFILSTCLFIFTFFSNFTVALWPLLAVAGIGALVGFLAFNIYPAKMFMGDTGSQFLALMVSFFGIRAIWNLPATYEIPSWTSIFLVTVAFSPAIADTLTVIINRTKKGISVMQGGKDHTTHHLVYKGFSDFKVWVIFTILGFFSFAFSAVLSYLTVYHNILFALLGLPYFLIVFIPLYRNTLKYHPPETKE